MRARGSLYAYFGSLDEFAEVAAQDHARWPLAEQRSAADALGRRGPGDFIADRVIVRPSCRLIGTYRSIPSCNRPAFLRLVRLLTVLIIAASAMHQTKSLVAD